jgi:hypothetical protein
MRKNFLIKLFVDAVETINKRNKKKLLEATPRRVKAPARVQERSARVSIEIPDTVVPSWRREKGEREKRLSITDDEDLLRFCQKRRLRFG